MMYGAQTWAVEKAQKKKLDVAEMGTFEMDDLGHKMDRLRNGRIGVTTKVGEMSKKGQERTLKLGIY